MTRMESVRAEQRRIEKELGPQIGKLSGALKKAAGDEAARLQRELDEIKARPAALKSQISSLESQIAQLEPELDALLLQVPLPPDDDVPQGKTSDDNIQTNTPAAPPPPPPTNTPTT